VIAIRVLLLASAAWPALAAAAEKKASVAGYFHGFFGAGRHDEGPGEPNRNTRDHWVAREAEIHFLAEIKLDSGLKVGVQVELEAETCADQIDETFVSFEGGFGRVLLGSTNGAPYKMAVLPKSALPGHGFSDPRFFHGQSGTNSVGRLGPLLQTIASSDSEKVTYFTPRIGGLQLGASYAPDRCEEAGCGGSYGGTETDNDLNQQSEAVELGAHYARRIGEVDLALSGGWARGRNENPGPGMTDQREWSAGASLGWQGFTLAAAWHGDNRARRGRGDRDDWGGSLHYALGAWSFSLGGVRTVVEEPAGGEDAQTLIEGAASYALGPGVTGSLGVQNYVFTDDLDAPAAENRALYVIAGLTLVF
jgi:outer membrane protein OmpU